MGLELINLSKSTDKLLNAVIQNVLIQTNDNLYSANPTYNDWKNAGYIEDAAVKVTAKPNIIELIDGTSISKAFDISWEVTSLQYYSLYEFEKFNNKLCTINLSGVSTYLKNIIVNLSLDATFNKKGEAKVKLSGTKRVTRLRDLIDGNIWGALTSPWVDSASIGGILNSSAAEGAGLSYL